MSCSSSSSDTVKGPSEDLRGCYPESTLNGIVGGQKVSNSDSDSKLVMMLNTKSSTGTKVCTASAIAPDVLLTAAHCVEGSPSEMFATLNSSLSCESGFDIRSVTIPVASFKVNEKYDKYAALQDTQGDIALVFLKQPLPSMYPIYKIARVEEISTSQDLQFYGYGSTYYSKESNAGVGILRKTTLPGTAITIDTISKRLVIEQSSGKGICTGDSGGPGLMKINGELQIVGINSQVEAPDFFASSSSMCSGKAILVLADSYRDWIDAQMKMQNRSLRK